MLTHAARAAASQLNKPFQPLICGARRALVKAISNIIITATNSFAVTVKERVRCARRTILNFRMETRVKVRRGVFIIIKYNCPIMEYDVACFPNRFCILLRPCYGDMVPFFNFLRAVRVMRAAK